MVIDGFAARLVCWNMYLGFRSNRPGMISSNQGYALDPDILSLWMIDTYIPSDARMFLALSASSTFLLRIHGHFSLVVTPELYKS